MLSSFAVLQLVLLGRIFLHLGPSLSCIAIARVVALGVLEVTATAIVSSCFLTEQLDRILGDLVHSIGAALHPCVSILVTLYVLQHPLRHVALDDAASALLATYTDRLSVMVA